METCERKGNRLSWSHRRVQQTAILPEYCLMSVVLSPEDRGQSRFLFFRYSSALGTSISPCFLQNYESRHAYRFWARCRSSSKLNLQGNGWKNHLSQVAWHGTLWILNFGWAQMIQAKANLPAVFGLHRVQMSSKMLASCLEIRVSQILTCTLKFWMAHILWFVQRIFHFILI